MIQNQNTSLQKEPIAIIGSGCRFPGNAISPLGLWELLSNPKDITKDIPESRFNAKGFYHTDGEHHGASNVTKAYFLEQDPRLFDSGFFNIAPREAEAIDPQQRMVLETVYEAMEDAGLTLNSMRGSSTGCYVGVMTGDYAEVVTRDPETFSQYMATGTSRALISNRVSYVFDWSGPSMTVDTACSSSLVAVHLAVQALRSGDVRVACAAGSNLILNADSFIGETSLHMLSTDGKSKMWDKSANGYARGEGVAAVFLKTLSQALKDGDRIDAIIRETGVNQDGRTQGITLPSPEAQAALIRSTYHNAGLDIDNPQERCQYFEAHGTGTQAGDPREASAINQAFFPNEDGKSATNPTLYVGSIKTVIGHTEGCAGVAGLLKAALALKHKTIPPNQHFHTLNPSVAPSYSNLCVPVSSVAWPSVQDGVVRRASVNSFGFGGTNAHAILESYIPELHDFVGRWGTPKNQLLLQSSKPTHPFNGDFTPLPVTFSANSNAALVKMVERYADYLRRPGIPLHEVAFTLHYRRSWLPIKVAFAGPSRQLLLQEMDHALAKASETKTELGKRPGPPSSETKMILGVFTGQGAQWPTMGACLLRHSAHFRNTIAELDASLASLPDAPTWTLAEEIAAPSSTSRVREAAISQPACTALQVALVDLLHAANISFHTVIGHSSGEIGAAYAAGFISGSDAVRIAYYRGVHAKHAGGRDGQEGSMIAVGWGMQQALEFCSREPQLNGRLVMAASNSPGSVTLSGDKDAVELAKTILDDKGVFNRVLQVDTAYHSHHMIPCSEGYLESLRACGIQVQEPRGGCTWISSVNGGEEISFDKDKHQLAGPYWRDNMVQAVLFSQAVEGAIARNPFFSMAIEVGPHPALKGPVLQTIKDAVGDAILYEGVLDRKKDDVAALASALAAINANLGPSTVDLESYANAFFSEPLVPCRALPCRPVGDMPGYPWDHRLLWRESRINKQLRSRTQQPLELLGARTTDDSDYEPRWRNILKVEELPWLRDHRIQGQIVVPGAMYCAMALEAAASLGRLRGENVYMLEICNLEIIRATAIDDGSEGSETLFSLHTIDSSSTKKGIVTANFSLSSAPIEDSIMRQVCTGSIRIYTSHGGTRPQPARREPSPEYLLPMNVDRFYTALGDLGLGYTGAFRAVSSLERSMNRASALVSVGAEYKSAVVHPSWLDVCFQVVFAAFAANNDASLWTAFLPTKIGSMKLLLTPTSDISDLVASSDFIVDSYISRFETAAKTSAMPKMTADIDVFDEASGMQHITIQDLTMTALTPATAKDDRPVFQQTIWKQDILSGVEVDSGPDARYKSATATDDAKVHRHWELCNQLACYYLKLALNSTGSNPITSWTTQLSQLLPAQDISANSWSQLQLETIDLKLIAKAGERLLFESTTGTRTSRRLQHQSIKVDETLPSLLEEWQVARHGIQDTIHQVRRIVGQIAHKHPRMRILQVDAAINGGITSEIMTSLGSQFASYTVAVDEGESNSLDQGLEIQDERLMVVGFDSDYVTAGAFDMVLLMDPLTAMDRLQHVRKLIRSGGFLVMVHPETSCLYINFLKGSISRHSSGDDATPDSSILSLSLPQLHRQLRDSGFSGVLSTAGASGGRGPVASVVVSQATDESMAVLCKPLLSSASTSISNAFTGDLVILSGSSSLSTITFAESLQSRLNSVWKGRIYIMDSLPNNPASTLAKVSAIISLAELDQPTFQYLDRESFARLQDSFKSCKTIQYIINTSSPLGPYHAAMVGLARTLISEDPEMMLQFVDVDELEGSETIIAETLLRLIAGKELAGKYASSTDAPLWTTELELALKDGKLCIPRVVLDQRRNNAINSIRRVVETQVCTSSTLVSLFGTDNGSHAARTVEIGNQKSGLLSSSALSLVWVEMCMKDSSVAGYNERQYLCVGTLDNGRRVVALAPTNASLVQVPENRFKILGSLDHTHDKNVTGQTIVRLHYAMQAKIIQSMLPKASHILLYIADDTTARFAQAYLGLKPEIDAWVVRFTPDAIISSTDQKQKVITIKHGASRREIVKSIPRHINAFVMYTVGGISEQESLSTLLGYMQDSSIRVVSLDSVQLAQDSIDGLLPRVLADLSWLPAYPGDVAFVKAADLVADGDPVAADNSAPVVIDWAGDQNIKVRALPIDATGLFSADKTYILVGLSGQMGQSICKWMAESGARNIVVTSRNPQKQADWISDLESCGVQIRVESADVTCEKDMIRLINSVSQSMPQIGGVMNGAMLLADGMFSNMSFENMQKVLSPKVIGSQILDQVLSNLDLDLDFFIMLSSVNAATGMAGQANYSAANMFMVGLAKDRRRRGLAASVVDIGMVIGIGVIQRMEGDSGTGTIETNLRQQNLAPISEPDLHHLLAEAIIAGTRDEDVEIISGLQPYISPSPNRPAWYKNPRFSHLVFDNPGAIQGNQSESNTDKATVLEAANAEEACQLLETSFIGYLGVELKIPANEISAETPIIDLGVDSLVAAAIRSWFFTEHSADVPVLKILGGASIHQVCHMATLNMTFTENATTATTERRSPDISSSSVTPSSSESVSSSTSTFSESPTPASSGNQNSPFAIEDSGKVEVLSPQSFGESRLYYSSEYLEDISPFNCTTSYRLHGSLNVTELEKALQLVITRHNIFRTVFYTDKETGHAMKAVMSESKFQLSTRENCNTATDIKAEFQRIHHYAFDLAIGDTFIATLLSHDSNSHTLIFGYHHIIMDGVSWQLFLQDLSRCFQDPSASLQRSLPASMIEFGENQRIGIEIGEYAERLNYWREIFAKPPNPLPLFPFASVTSRRALTRYSMRDTMVSIDSSLIAAIKNASLASKVTPFHFWLAGFQVLLQRLLKANDITIGIVDANRTNPTFAQTIGFLLEIMPVRFHVDDNSTFSQLLKETRTKFYGALGNSGVPIEELAKACGISSDKSQTPFVQVILNYRMGATNAPKLGDCNMEFLNYSDAKVPYDLAVSIDEKEDGTGFLTVSAQDYLYDQGSVDLLISSYKYVLGQVSSATSTIISQVPLEDPMLVQRAIELGTGVPLDHQSFEPDTLSKRIDKWVHADPTACAVKDAYNSSFTYQELSHRANQIANAMQAIEGFGKHSRVAVLCDPIADISATILGIHRCAAVFVPLDIYATDQRLLDILEESRFSILIHHGPTTTRAQKIITRHRVTLINLDSISNAQRSVTPVQDISSPQDTAYLLYTSGSTGKPKGIPLTHANICTTISATTQHLSLKREVVLQQTGQGFDAAAWELHTALTNGGTVIITDNHGDPAELADLIRRERVTTALIIISEFNSLLQYGSQSLRQCSDWHTVIGAGEQFTSSLLDKLIQLELPNLRVFNGYGPTETSILSSVGKVALLDAGSRDNNYRVPIGAALPGYGMYVVDEGRRALPLGAVGELAICGDGVAQSGYLGRPELTVSKWVPATFLGNNAEAHQRGFDSLCYLTGDRAKMLSDGSFLIMGRMDGDSQVKLRGLRVELDEVASCIVESASGLLSDARVVVRSGASTAAIDHKFLAAFVVFARDSNVVDEREYLQSLLLSLPLASYMRPSVAVALPALPFTERGKLDTKRLQEIDLPSAMHGEDQQGNLEELTELEATLKAVWIDVVQAAGGLPLRINRDSDFFSIGGNSLLLLRLKADIQRKFGVHISLAEMFRNSTIRHMAGHIQGSSDTAANIVWEQETEPPADIPQVLVGNTNILGRALHANTGMCILLTGATGFLGKAILRQLVSNPSVQLIHCLAVRNSAIFPAELLSSKITLHPGNLAEPLLGLPDNSAALNLFAQADAVIHNGAEVSHMKGYRSLRAANVESTREICRLILQSCNAANGIPKLHFVSTAGVALLTGWDSLPEEKLPVHAIPPIDGSQGYISSKYASEMLLEKLHERVPGMRIVTHRPSNITGDGVGSSDIVHNILRFSTAIKAVPNLGADFGAFDFISVDTAAKSIVDAALTTESGGSGDVLYHHQSGEVIVQAGELREHLGHSDTNPIDILPLQEWVTMALVAGMDGLLASFLLETPGGVKMPKLEKTLVKGS